MKIPSTRQDSWPHCATDYFPFGDAHVGAEWHCGKFGCHLPDSVATEERLPSNMMDFILTKSGDDPFKVTRLVIVFLPNSS